MKVLTHKRHAEKRVKDIDSWNIAAQDKKEIREFLKLYEQGEITNQIGTNVAATIERTTEYLKPAYIYVNQTKPVSKLNPKTDKKITQDFQQALLKDEIKSSRTGNPYSLKTKKGILKTFSKILQWKFPDDYLPLTKPLNIKISSKLAEPEFLTEQEIDKLHINCDSAEHRYVNDVLFGSGARAEEFFNIRLEDWTLPKEGEVFVKLRIKNTTSKTKGRTISLYYNKCLESVKEFLAQRISEGCKPDEPVITTGYETTRSWMRALGKRVLNKNVHFHLYRSSCATWLAPKIPNKQEFCYYFGWSFSSPMPDTYINRIGASIGMTEVNEKFQKTEYDALKRNMEKNDNEKSIKIDKLTEEVSELKTIVDFKNSVQDAFVKGMKKFDFVPVNINGKEFLLLKEKEKKK